MASRSLSVEHKTIPQCAKHMWPIGAHFLERAFRANANTAEGLPTPFLRAARFFPGPIRPGGAGAFSAGQRAGSGSSAKGLRAPLSGISRTNWPGQHPDKGLSETSATGNRRSRAVYCANEDELARLDDFLSAVGRPIPVDDRTMKDLSAFASRGSAGSRFGSQTPRVCTMPEK
jgi:hypothetical protein